MFRTVLTAFLVLAFTAGVAGAESAAWLDDYIEKGPSRQLTKTTPATEKAAPAPTAKAPKSKVSKRVGKAQAKKKAKASKRRRR